MARQDLDQIEIAAPLPNDELLALNDALEQLAAQDPQKAELSNCASSPA